MSDPRDRKNSRMWQARLWDVDGEWGVTNAWFDFTNIASGRTHRVEFIGGGIDLGPWMETEKTSFSTSRSINFNDLEGIGAQLRGGGGPHRYGAKLTILDDIRGGDLAVVEFKLRKPSLFPVGTLFSAGVLVVRYNRKGQPHIGENLKKEKKRLALEEETKGDDGLTSFTIEAQEDPAIPADALFDFGSAKLRPGAEKHLRKWLKILNERTSLFVHIEGHTDSVGTPEYNTGLSFRRAQAVKNWLETNGVKGPTSIVVTGAGETTPVASNATKEGRQKNRRVEIKFR